VSADLYQRVRAYALDWVRRSRRLSSIVRRSANATIISLTIFAALSILASRDQTIADAEKTQIVLAKVIAENVRQAFSAINMVQQSIVDDVLAMEIEDEASLRQALADRSTFEMLRNKISAVPQIDVATIVALNGDVINFTRSFPTPKISLADRAYFQEQINSQTQIFSVSIPYQNRGNGGWTFYFTRKLLSKQGKPVGVILIGTPPSYYVDKFRSLMLDDFFSISLLRNDGALLARYPEVDGALGRTLKSTGLDALNQNLKSVITDAPVASDPAISPLRLIAPSALEGYPTTITVSARMDGILAAWFLRSIRILIGLAIASIALAGLSYWLVLILEKDEKRSIERRDMERRSTAENLLALEQTVRDRVAENIQIRRDLDAVAASAQQITARGRFIEQAAQQLCDSLIARFDILIGQGFGSDMNVAPRVGIPPTARMTSASGYSGFGFEDVIHLVKDFAETILESDRLTFVDATVLSLDDLINQLRLAGTAARHQFDIDVEVQDPTNIGKSGPYAKHMARCLLYVLGTICRIEAGCRLNVSVNLRDDKPAFVFSVKRSRANLNPPHLAQLNPEPSKYLVSELEFLLAKRLAARDGYVIWLERKSQEEFLVHVDIADGYRK